MNLKSSLSQVSSSYNQASSSEFCCFQNKNKTVTGSPEPMEMLHARHMLTAETITVWPIYNRINLLQKGCAGDLSQHRDYARGWITTK